MATAKLTFDARFDDEEVGMVVMGMDYGAISLVNNKGKLEVRAVYCSRADKNGYAEIIGKQPVDYNTIYFRVRVGKDAECRFSYSPDGSNFKDLGKPFKAKAGKWIGAKVGFFALRNGNINDAGSADIDWFRIEK